MRLLDLFEDENYFYIVMEQYGGGDLLEYLEERDFNLSEKRVKELMYQLATAV